MHPHCRESRNHPRSFRSVSRFYSVVTLRGVTGVVPHLTRESKVEDPVQRTAPWLLCRRNEGRRSPLSLLWREKTGRKDDVRWQGTGLTGAVVGWGKKRFMTLQLGTSTRGLWLYQGVRKRCVDSLASIVFSLLLSFSLFPLFSFNVSSPSTSFSEATGERGMRWRHYTLPQVWRDGRHVFGPCVGSIGADRPSIVSLGFTLDVREPARWKSPTYLTTLPIHCPPPVTYTLNSFCWSVSVKLH